jgi:hypothetical protein
LIAVYYYRTLIVNPNSACFAEIELIPNISPVNFTAASGGTITVNNGGSINFAPNSIATASTGAAYSGNVNVSAFYLNPADAAFGNYMPGDLRGINSNNNERLLQSFGMMVVELKGSNGEKLQLATGKTAALTIPIAQALQASAPATIPLWHFDEVAGLWKEEGTGSRQGNNYTANVSHFSTWNWDLPYPLINFEALYKDQQGATIPYARVTFKRPNGQIRMGFTDANGYLQTPVAAGEILVMSLLNSCGSVISSQNIGPYNSNTNAGTFTINMPAPVTATITGTAVSCSGAPIANGIIDIQLEGITTRAAISNGSFSVQVARCDASAATATMIAFDTAAGVQSTPTDITVTTGTVNAGALSACNVTGEYIYLTVNGINYSWLRPNDVAGSSRNYLPPPANQYSTSINASKVVNFNSQELQLKFPGPTAPAPGIYGLTLFQFYPNGHGPNDPYFALQNVMSVTITEYGLPGGILKGSFSGMVRQTGSTALAPVFCSFRVIRGGI